MKTAFRLVLTVVLLLLVLWAVSGYYSIRTTASDDQYVGSEACKDCHEEQFKNFVPTSHAKLGSLGSWKNKVTGCESCHGPGKAHLEEGDPAKIVSFKNKPAKQISETGRNIASSNTFITSANAEKPDFSTIKLLESAYRFGADGKLGPEWDQRA